MLPRRRPEKLDQCYRFCQDLAVLGFGPDRYDDTRMEEKDIQYFKRLSMYTTSDHTESRPYTLGKRLLLSVFSNLVDLEDQTYPMS